jgi:hypothetical protein
VSRVRLQEMSWQRLRDAVLRRVRWLPSQVEWRLGTAEAKRHHAKLNALAGRHDGERCFLLANGPSLARVDLDRLAGETVFGMNRIYLLFGKTRMRPRYYVCINELILQQFAADIQALECMKFLSWSERRRFARSDASICYLPQSTGLKDTFSDDPARRLSGGGTVTFVALQLAGHMGFREVVLLGLDHSFSSKGVPNTTEVRPRKPDQDHFDPAYFPPGVRWQLPDLRRSEAAYRLARQAFEQRGGRILDATAGGQCSVFEKAALESLL